MGPGNCDGGQQCNDAGTKWSSCDCGSAAGGTTGTGGSESGGAGGADNTGGSESGGMGGADETGGSGGSDTGGSGGTINSGGSGSADTGGSGGTINTGGSGGYTGGSGGADTGGSGGIINTGGSGGDTGGSGGTGGTGGDFSTGGSGGTGGSTITCGASLGILDGYYDNGTMCGYAWTTGFDGGTIDPACGLNACFIGATLCASGSIPANDTVNNIYPGIAIGWNVAQGSGAPIVSNYTTTGIGITVNFTVTGVTGEVRVALQASDGHDYCATATSGTAIPWTSFKTNCWAGGTQQDPLPASSAIRAIVVQLFGADTPQTITDFCVNSVVNN